ncbi:hypothetical protein CW745_16365 [Psychromonas sp. psych-6C06]|uniref:hypothetical protein n=1 Tax=Psychromonas sp. psych-6C06 TaxID=2058089 RepID=UPI000C321CB1|nr:hypothetical protein [Psychromonas sp. psych-6C06]PKF60181.1 hypothetical protein CW745_16365 [Psychromonas sp. psych-6C06]
MKSKKLSLFIAINLAFFLTLYITGETESIDVKEYINTYSDKTKYVLVDNGRMDNIVQSGSLGDFYNCISNFQSIRSRNAKPGISKSWKLWVSDDIFIKINTAQNETYSFYLEKRSGGKLIGLSDSYAVNCSFDLLNVTDKRTISVDKNWTPIEHDIYKYHN